MPLVQPPTDPHLLGWMLFVDGENLAIRAQRVFPEVLTPEGGFWTENVFVWVPDQQLVALVENAARAASGDDPRSVQWRASEDIRAHLARAPLRALYYTTVAGDDASVDRTRTRLWELGFQPRVFKKHRDKAKAVDIALATDVLHHAYLDNYGALVLVAGDRDYVPLVDEVKGRGKYVVVTFFEQGPNAGLDAELRLAADAFVDFGPLFEHSWRSHRGRLEQPD